MAEEIYDTQILRMSHRGTRRQHLNYFCLFCLRSTEVTHPQKGVVVHTSRYYSETSPLQNLPVVPLVKQMTARSSGAGGCSTVKEKNAHESEQTTVSHNPSPTTPAHCRGDQIVGMPGDWAGLTVLPWASSCWLFPGPIEKRKTS